MLPRRQAHGFGRRAFAEWSVLAKECARLGLKTLWVPGAACLHLLLCLILCAAADGKAPEDAPPLPAATGRVVAVSDVEALYRAVADLQSNTTIVLNPGVYQLHRSIFIRGTGQFKNVSLRGATGKFRDVIISGMGMGKKEVPHGILVENVEGLLIADVTIGWVGFHPIALTPGGVQKVHIYHCRLVDAGQQFIKVSFRDPATAIHDGIVEYCRIEYTDHGPKDGYTNGVDILGGRNWIVRHNLLRNIRSPREGKMTGPAVLAWRGAENTRCEQNTFLNCDRPIALGLVSKDGGPDHRGGVIANNFIATDKQAVPHADAAICVWDSPATKVLHNTIFLGGAYPNAIDVRWPRSREIAVENNLCDGRIVTRDGATVRKQGNQLALLSADLFQNAAAGDLHLKAPERPQRVPPLPGCALDWDGAPRPASATVVGADEPVAPAEK